MVGASKILTVSYGTFSCTLEGFDEPFSTMKAIAEYFRDLAADDRYFGAEPPTPDPEMLHRIAEREIQRRVEARVNEHGLFLRQTDATPAEVPQAQPQVQTRPEPAAPATVPMVSTDAQAPATAAVAVPAAVVVEAAVSQAEEPVAVAAPVEADIVAEAEPEFSKAETADLAEAPAELVADELPEPAVVEPASAESVVVEPDAAEAIAAEPDVVEPVAVEQPAAEPEEEEFSLEALMAEAAADEPAELAGEPAETLAIESLPATGSDDMADGESVAAKLMRIRAVVEDVRSGRTNAYEDEEEADLVDAAPRVDSDFGFDLDLDDGLGVAAHAPVADDHSTDSAVTRADAPEAEMEPDLSALFASEQPAEVTEIHTDAVMVEDEVETAESETDDRALLEQLSQMSILDDDEDDMAADQPSDTLTTAEMPVEAEAEDSAAPEPATQPGFFERARARVIRLSRSALHSAEEDRQAEVTEVAPAETTAHEAETVAHVDDYDDAAEDSDPQFDAGLTDVPATDFEEEDHAAAQDHAGARALLDVRAEEADDFPRLMEEAKSKLEGVENRRRFSAISHLKAAVAATLADRKMHPSEQAAEAEAEEEKSLYRDDLSKAVRPRRPASEGATTRRPTAVLRPAPLVLVSEQRVDQTSDGVHEGAVIRPRRIAAGNLAVTIDEDEDLYDDVDDVTPESVSSFAEFAERTGASSLVELLEAAAVYTASIEGRESFSRPHLLRKVEFVSSRGDYSREDGLRSFGMLLRQGKIQKIARGQFTIADKTQFRA